MPMRPRPLPLSLVLVFACLVAATYAAPAAASFHLMQIEQVVGGVCGDASQQAIQLRTRNGGQSFVASTRLVARDAAGGNPVTLLTFSSNVANGASGARILATTSALASTFGVTADFTLTQPIPESYLAAGRLTFEDGGGNAYWSLAWGGASYTGSNTGTFDNDGDGNFGPPFGSALPKSTSTSVRFPGASTAPSTSNAADYAFSSGAATLVNNAGGSTTLPCVFGDGFASGDLSAWSTGVSLELCNGTDDDADADVDEDYPVGHSCALPNGSTGAFVCAANARGVVCS